MRNSSSLSSPLYTSVSKNPRGPPLIPQAYEISRLAKDFQIPERFPGYFQISREISRFPERFVGFPARFSLKISGISSGFEISPRISCGVFRISACHCRDFGTLATDFRLCTVHCAVCDTFSARG